MEPKNKVFIATSMDGFIADINGGLDWLHAIPNPDGSDMGYEKFVAQTDAVVMGRNTFETVCSFDIPWPYKKPVFVLSNSIASIPKKYREFAEPVHGNIKEVLQKIHQKNYNCLYIDGGKTIQSFLQEDLIDEMTITIIPFLLGEGIPLFGYSQKKLKFNCVDTKHYDNGIVQNHFVRSR